MTASAASPTFMPKKSFREISNPKSIFPKNGAFYYEFTLPKGCTVHLVAVYLKEGKWRLRPVLLDKTMPTSVAARKFSASAAINGGYFNLSDGASTSYVLNDGKVKADPHENKALVDNPKLKSFLGAIFDRSEIRILRKTGQKATEIQIARHSDPLPEGFEILDSLQAGPRLLPALEAENEAFLRRQEDGSITDSISCKKAAARSAFGITNDGYAIFLAAAGQGQDPESAGITLYELQDLMRHLGCRQAINLDGGSSTSLYVRFQSQEDSNKTGSVCAKDPETNVKSVLMLMPQ